jgi:Zn-dependent M28 family amino/carboxypeptidase
VTRNGGAEPHRILLVGAHYDSIAGSPGANDNASGVAALLELSRFFIGIAPHVTTRFVAFANEEPPSFFGGQQGSLVYARDARRRGDDIRLMVSLEAIGYYCDRPGSQRYLPLFRFFYPDKGNFVGFVSDFRSAGMMRRFAELACASSDFPLEHVATFRIVPGVAWSCSTKRQLRLQRSTICRRRPISCSSTAKAWRIRGVLVSPAISAF